jgi:hypothetical protein
MMADQLRFLLTANGEPLRCEHQTQAGVLLSGDGPDLFGRAVSLEFWPLTEDFRLRFRRRLAEQGWRELFLTMNVDEGAVIFDSDHPFPPMVYGCRLRIQGLEMPAIQHVDIGEDAVPIDIPVPILLTTLASVRTPSDAKIKKLLEDPNSRIDGMPALDWVLTSEDAARKACVLNLLAKLRCVPSIDKPLIDYVDSIIAVQLERVYARVRKEIVSAAGPLQRAGAFNDKGPPNSSTHQLLVTWIASKLDPPETAAYTLKSYRQDVTRDSLQVVIASPHDRASNAGWYADLDIDLGDPLTDIVGFVTHMHELSTDTITDHVALYEDLAEDPALNPFLYYKVNA